MADGPVRMSRRRAQALYDLAGRGLDEERASIEDNYGVAFRNDGTVDITDTELREPGDLEGMDDRLELLTDGRAAMTILYNRYLT